jgi:polyisoprenoid-binding protein YceI
MKKVLLLSAFTVLSFCLFAQWAVDKGHSKVSFIVTHHGISELDGYFKKYDVTLTSSKNDLSDAVFDMTIETASINTDLEMRDNDLKGKDLFDAEQFPNIHFVSTAVKKKQGNQYDIAGNITIKGVTKPIVLAAVINGPVPNPGNPKAVQVGIKATGTIKRSDFNIGAKLTSAFVSDEVQIRVTGEFGKSL